MDKEQKSEFLLQMQEIAKQAIDLMQGDPKKAMIMIASETDETGTDNMIAVGGCKKELVKSIITLITEDEIKDLIVLGISNHQSN